MYCSRCGSQNADGVPYCGKCGNVFPVAAGSAGVGAVIIPYRNPMALTGYYLAIFSLACGIFLGLPAVILGIFGLKAVKANPDVHGTVHAWVGILLGGLTTLASLVLIVAGVIALQRQ